MNKAQEKLKKYCFIDRTYSQKQIADSVGCSTSYVHFLIHCKDPNPTVRVALKMQEFLSDLNINDWVEDEKS